MKGVSSVRQAAQAMSARAVTAAGAVSGRLQPAVGVISALGWGVLAVAIGAWVVGWRLGWVELSMLATGAAALFVLCIALTLGRTKLDVTVEVSPQRVRVGDPAAGRALARNASRGVLLSLQLELPVGLDTARFTLPLLRPGARHEELFVVPTARRGVITIGPARTVRGDPLGIARRSDVRTPLQELFVHPLTVPLEPLGAGLLRDLEGQVTPDVSMSDLAFHTLREYRPGDDRRYIHWRSSAKIQGRSGGVGGDFLVRQFLDTRRTHIAVVLDSFAGSYTGEDDFELAVSAAASIAVRVIIDEQQLSIVTGTHALADAVGHRALDTFARAEPSGQTLAELAVRTTTVAPDASTVVLVTGPVSTFADLQRSAAHFAPETRVLALRVDPEARTNTGGTSLLPVLTLQTLSELPALLAGGPL